jgi:hypothetical protein
LGHCFLLVETYWYVHRQRHLFAASAGSGADRQARAIDLRGDAAQAMFWIELDEWRCALSAATL